MNLSRVIGLALVASVLASAARADEEMSPYPYVQAAPNGRYYFRMTPDPKAPLEHGGSGIAYEVAANGDRELWRVSGWYAFKVFLMEDGRHLVRVGNWPRGRQVSDEHLALAFYEDGKLVKKYSTKELIEDPSKVEASVSHYAFYREEPRLVRGDDGTWELILVSADGIKRWFNVETGEVVLLSRGLDN